MIAVLVEFQTTIGCEVNYLFLLAICTYVGVQGRGVKNVCSVHIYHSELLHCASFIVRWPVTYVEDTLASSSPGWGYYTVCMLRENWLSSRDGLYEQNVTAWLGCNGRYTQGPRAGAHRYPGRIIVLGTRTYSSSAASYTQKSNKEGKRTVIGEKVQLSRSPQWAARRNHERPEDLVSSKFRYHREVTTAERTNTGCSRDLLLMSSYLVHEASHAADSRGGPYCQEASEGVIEM